MKTPRSHVREVLDGGGIDEEMECLSRRIAKLVLKRFHPPPAIHKGIMLTFVFKNRTFTRRQSGVSHDPVHSLPFTTPMQPWEDPAPFRYTPENHAEAFSRDRADH